MSRQPVLDAGPIRAAVKAAQGSRTLTELLGDTTAERRAFDRARQRGTITPDAAVQLCEAIGRVPEELYPQAARLFKADAAGRATVRRRPKAAVGIEVYQQVWDRLTADDAEDQGWTGDLIAEVAAVTGPTSARTVARALLAQGWLEWVDRPSAAVLPAAPLVQAVLDAGRDRPLHLLLGAETPARWTFRKARQRGTVSHRTVRQLCAVIGRDPHALYPHTSPPPAGGYPGLPRHQLTHALRQADACYRLVRRPAIDRVACGRPGCNGTVPNIAVSGGLYVRRARDIYCSERCRRWAEREGWARAADRLRRAADLPQTGSHKLTPREMHTIARQIGRLRSRP
jgi:hypothetical protein